MKKFQFLFLGIVLFSFVIGCKDKDDDKIYLEFLKSGYIKVNLTGTSSDGISLNEALTFDSYVSIDEATFDTTKTPTENYKTFNLSRGIGAGNQYVNLGFEMHDGGLIENAEVYLNFTKNMSDNQLLSTSFYCNNENGSTLNLTNVKYENNTITGNFTGKYEKINLSGDFNLPVYQEINK